MTKKLNKAGTNPTILIKHREGFSMGMMDVMEKIFPRSPLMPEIALEWLKFIKSTGKEGLHASRWKEFCEKHLVNPETGKIKEGVHNDIKRKLKGIGLIQKVNGYWFLSKSFSRHLKQFSEVIEDFIDRPAMGKKQ